MGWRGLVLSGQDEQSCVQGFGVAWFTLILYMCAPWVCKIVTCASLLFSVILGVDYNAA